MLRQGDVLLIPVESIPKAAVRLDRDKGRVVLAYGEATGHAHAIAEPDVDLLGYANDRYLRATASGATLRYEEYAAIEVPPGQYRVVVQREYSPEAVRPVAD
jgi:hypothetical protein